VWDAILPAELLVLPAELGRSDVLLDDPVFFAPFATHFDARIGRVAFRPVESPFGRCGAGHAAQLRPAAHLIDDRG